MAHDIVLRRLASRTPKPLGPAHLRERGLTLSLCAVARRELRQRHAGLELDSVHGHRWLPSCDKRQLRQSVAHWMSLAELRDESG
jgi:hypothetical protein